MKKQIKIAHVISSLKMGGAEAVLVDLVRNLPDYEHQVIYFHAGPHVQTLHTCGIITHHVKGLVCLYDPVFWFRLLKRLFVIKPDLMHGSLWAANYAVRFLGRLLKIPIICSLHAHADINGATRQFLDRYCPEPDCFVVVSDAVRSSTLQKQSWISAQKLITIQDGIDVHDVIKKCEHYKIDRSTFQLTDKEFVIGAVGRFAPEKNFSVLIEAFAQFHKKYHHVRLLLIGYGQEEQLLRALVLSHGLVEVVFFVIGQPAYGYYALMDCFVLPSKSEALSLALLEAMSCGLPCILSSLEFKHDILIDKKNGLVVPANTPDNFANALEQLLNDKELRTSLGRQAQRTVQQQCDTGLMVAQYKKLYDKILGM